MTLIERVRLVVISPSGAETSAFPLRDDGPTTIGRANADLSFPDDALLDDVHATVARRDGRYWLHDEGSRSGTYLRLRPRTPIALTDGDLLRVGRQILVVSNDDPDDIPRIDHFNVSGRQVGRYPIRGTMVLGRGGGTSPDKAPDLNIGADDPVVSQRHLSVTAEAGTLHLRDLDSTNGTYLRVTGERMLEPGDIVRVGTQQLRFC